jgi:hypothetical protein
MEIEFAPTALLRDGHLFNVSIGVAFAACPSLPAVTSSTMFCCCFLPLLLFRCPFKLFARLLIISQAKPVVLKLHRRLRRLRPDPVANNSVEASKQRVLACYITLDAGSFQRKWISDGIAIFSNWLKCQQDAFCEQA